jgi:FdhD protein
MLATVDSDAGADEVAVELPLEIRLNGQPVAVTMRTPGHDHELAAGFLYGEGVIEGRPDVEPPADLAANTVDVRAPGAEPPPSRRFYATSSC